MKFEQFSMMPENLHVQSLLNNNYQILIKNELLVKGFDFAAIEETIHWCEL